METEVSDTENLTTVYAQTNEYLLAHLYCNLSVATGLEIYNGSQNFCNESWDGVSCWPITLAGNTANVPCFSELNGVKYDINGNASRECLLNASWSSWSNYRSCVPLKIPEDEYLQVLWDMKDAVTVYYVGYGISLIALTLALGIFICFKDLRCLRNTIHANLMFTYLLLDITWILTAKLQSSQNYVSSRVACFLTIFLTYLMGTNFFWMFVEGLYLFILVVKTFTVDNIKIYVYVLIGWVFPALIAATWAIVKGHFGHTIDSLAPQGCPWQTRDYYDYIFISPVLLVLLINTIFLIKIMWVLITKLRATNTIESEQYRKAAKALLVLIPLLGVTYILVIATPNHRTGEVIFTFIQATLLSIQGFIVAVLYCFLNGEVQNSVRHRLERWKIRRAVQYGQHHSLNCRSSPHDEKFYQGRNVRDSCISFATSTSFINFQSITSRSPSIPAINKLENCSSHPETICVKDDIV
ncbi:diuretic hormone receptor-like [Parasteatoda tepidariorum]|uniref:diuretic hormone receptor-like n=1 Tax=Parasteatoda tepidariorum TaxID=114398 RepID=UPI00077FD129|nr:diuretic hormone receptor-like [Parasteatoda tepidariorum]